MRTDICLRAFSNYPAPSATQPPFQIPTQYYNKFFDNNRDLKVCDFYWAGSRKSYLPCGQTFDVCSLQAISGCLNAGARIINLDLYPDGANQPVVRNDTLMPGYGVALSLRETFALIAANAWKPPYQNHPLILYLGIHSDNRIFLFRIYETIRDVFATRMLNKKYSFCGRNNQFPLGQAPIAECLGRIAIVTDKYPLIGVLNEFINGTTQADQQYIQRHNYTATMEAYGGMLVKSADMDSMKNYNRFNLTMIYPEGTTTSTNIYNPKVDLYNPPADDCWKYGCQWVMMNYQLADSKMLACYAKFGNGLQGLIPKPDDLRFIEQPPLPVVNQNPNASYAPRVLAQPGWYSINI